MEIEGTTKNWDHFKEQEYFKRLFSLDQNIFLLGQKYSGKTALLNECIQNKEQEEQKENDKGIKKILKFNCLIFQNLNELRKKIVQEIYLVNSNNDRYKKKYNTFLQLEKAQQNQIEKNNLINFMNFCLIIENAENLLDIANQDHIKKFFLEIKYYLLENCENFNYQIVVLSTQDLPFPSDCFYQFTLPLPSENILRNYVKERINDLIQRDEKYEQNGELIEQLASKQGELLSNIMTYTTIAKDFLSFKTLTDNLYELRKKLLIEVIDSKSITETEQNKQKVYRSLDDRYQKIILYYFSNFARIFQPIDEIYNQVKQYETLQRENKHQPKVEIDDQIAFVNSHQNFINKIPKIAQFLLAAFGLAIKIGPKSDLQIFMGHDRKKKPKKGQIKQTQKVQKQKKYVKLSRVVAICELLMSRSEQFNSKMQNEQNDQYHSIEFYLNIDFLEKLKLVKKANLVSKDQNFEVNITEQILEITLNELKFKREEFYQLTITLIIIQIQR